MVERQFRQGFTLIELMVVVAIIALLAMVATSHGWHFLHKAKRAEVYMNLHAIYAAQKSFWAEHGRYSTVLSGQGGIGWLPEGYKGGGDQEKFYYTYGFSDGREGTGLFTGKLKAPSSALPGTYANDKGFLIAAAADLDGDGKMDVLTIDHNNAIKLVQDDLG